MLTSSYKPHDNRPVHPELFRTHSCSNRAATHPTDDDDPEEFGDADFLDQLIDRKLAIWISTRIFDRKQRTSPTMIPTYRIVPRREYCCPTRCSSVWIPMTEDEARVPLSTRKFGRLIKSNLLDIYSQVWKKYDTTKKGKILLSS